MLLASLHPVCLLLESLHGCPLLLRRVGVLLLLCCYSYKDRKICKPLVRIPGNLVSRALVL